MIQSYPWYIADWRNSETRLRLTLPQRGLYRELLDYCYLEGSLPGDRKLLIKIAGSTIEAEAELSPSTTVAQAKQSISAARARLGHDLSTVLALFKHDESTDRYHHPKVDEVLAKLVSYHAQKKHAGAKSGQARRERSFNVRSIDIPATPEPPPSPAPTPTPSPEHIPQTPNAPDGAFSLVPVAPKPARVKSRGPGKRTTEKVRKALGPERCIWFDALWKAGPWTDDKLPGMDAYEKRVHDVDLAREVHKGAFKYATKCAADPQIKIKFLQGWINDERWTDENTVVVIPNKPPRSATERALARALQEENDAIACQGN